MVKIYHPRVKFQFNHQHRAIIDWLDANPIYRDAYVLMGFTPPIRGGRDVDMAIYLHDRICVLELKRVIFSRIETHDYWYAIDPKTGNEEPHEMKKSGDPENPYIQATESADALKGYIKKKSHLTEYNDFQKFLESIDFKVYPIVYIDKNDFLKEEYIIKDRWCSLAIGVDDLEYSLSRIWFEFEGSTPSMDESFIINLIEDLKLISADESPLKRQGQDNTTLIAIIKFISENNIKLKNESDVKNNVFSIVEKRRDEVRRALRRGIEEQVLTSENGYYGISSHVKSLLEEGWSVNKIYSEWVTLRRIERLRITNPVIFNTIIGSQEIQQVTLVEEKTKDISYSIPDSLFIFSFDQTIRYSEKIYPLIFRPGGSYWSDYINELYIPFHDNEGVETASDSIIKALNSRKNVLVSGSSSSGKTTLIRKIGLAYLEEKNPVIIFNPKDLDREALNSILLYDRQFDEKYQKPLIVIVENIHLVSSTEAYWLKRLLKPYKGLRLLLSSRKHSINIAETDLLEVFRNEEEGVKFNLDNEFNLIRRVEEITSLAINHIVKTISEENSQRLSKEIAKRNDHNTILIQLELEVAISLSLNTDINPKGIPLTVSKNLKENEFLETIKDNERLNHGLEIQLIEQLTNLKDEIHSATKIKSETIMITLLLCYEFCYQEFPIRRDLITNIVNISPDEVQSIISYLDKKGEILYNEGSYFMVHPHYAQRIVEAAESIEGEYNVQIDRIGKILNDYGKNLSEKVRNKLFELDPSLKTDWTLEETTDEDIIDTQKISINKLIQIAPDLMAEDFYNLLQSIPGRIYGLNFYTWWSFWDQIGLDELYSMITNAGSIMGAIYLMREIYLTKWPKFNQLLTRIEPRFFLEVDKTGFVDHLPDILKYVKQWGYLKTSYLEIEGTLKYYLEFSGFRGFMHTEISHTSFKMIDNLNPVKIINEFNSNPNLRLENFLDFLRNKSESFKTESKLRMKILSFTLKNGLNNVPKEHFCSTLSHLTFEEIKRKKELSRIVSNWDISEIHDEMLNIGRSWFNYILTLIRDWEGENIRALIASFTIAEISELLKSNDPKDEEESYERLIFELERSEWPHLGGLFDSLGNEFFIEYLSNEANERYYDHNLLKLLLTTVWEEKDQFIDNFDFFSWSIKKDYFIVKILIPIFNGIQLQDDLKLILKYLFIESLKKEWGDREIKETIDFCKQLKYEWHEWIDINFLKDRLNNSPYRGIKIIELLEEEGWKIPIIITSQISDYETKQENKIWNRMTLMQKADHLYFQKKNAEDALKLYQEAASQINSASEISELRHFLHQIRNLTNEDIISVIQCISPRLSSHFYQIDTYWEVQEILKILFDLNYPLIAEAVAELYNRLLRSAEKQFWTDLEKYELGEDQMGQIFQTLLETDNFEKLSRLPEIFNQNFFIETETLFKKLYELDYYEPFIWESIKRLITISEDNTRVVLIKKVKDTLIMTKNLSIITSVIKLFQNDYPTMITEFFAKENDFTKNLIVNGQIEDIVYIFESLDSNVIIVETIVKILNKAEWEEKIKSGKPEKTFLLINWLVESYPELSKFINKDSDSLMVKFSK